MGVPEFHLTYDPRDVLPVVHANEAEALAYAKELATAHPGVPIAHLTTKAEEAFMAQEPRRIASYECDRAFDKYAKQQEQNKPDEPEKAVVIRSEDDL